MERGLERETGQGAKEAARESGKGLGSGTEGREERETERG